MEVNRFLVVLRTVFSLYMKPVTRNTFTYNTYSRCESDERRGAPGGRARARPPKKVPLQGVSQGTKEVEVMYVVVDRLRLF